MMIFGADIKDYTPIWSSLKRLVNLLGGPPKSLDEEPREFTKDEALAIEKEVMQLPTGKLLKYSKALEYLGKCLKINSFAIPINPTMTFQYFEVGSISFMVGDTSIPKEEARYNHVHAFRFESSNGDLGAFRNTEEYTGTLTREHIWYINDPAKPPFSDLMNRVPMDFYQPKNGSAGFTGVVQDNHSTFLPEYIICWPIKPGCVKAYQHYQYQVPNGEWKDITNAQFTIEKGVRAKDDGNGYVFYFSKKNREYLNPNAFHFEVEYDIGEKPTPFPTKLPKPLRVGEQRKDIRTYGRVLATGQPEQQAQQQSINIGNRLKKAPSANNAVHTIKNMVGDLKTVITDLEAQNTYLRVDNRRLRRENAELRRSDDSDSGSTPANQPDDVIWV